MKRAGRKRREARGEDARLQSSHAESDFHYQLWLFLFHFTTAINHRVTGSQGWRGWRAEGRKKRANFHQIKNYLSKQVRWSRGSARGLWKPCGQTEIYLGLIGSGRVVRGEQRFREGEKDLRGPGEKAGTPLRWEEETLCLGRETISCRPPHPSLLTSSGSTQRAATSSQRGLRGRSS